MAPQLLCFFWGKGQSRSDILGEHHPSQAAIVRHTRNGAIKQVKIR
ncbi:MAG: hypothetical protein ACP5RH_12870 [Leptodesmis sp.]